MTKERIIKAVWYDTQTARGYSFQYMKKENPAILTTYGRVINEDDIYLTVACYYESEAETKEIEDLSDVPSFYVRVLKSAIIELKELGIKKK